MLNDQILQGMNYFWFKCGHGIGETLFDAVAFEIKPDRARESLS